MRIYLIGWCMIILSHGVLAQNHHSEYVGLENRTVKSLSESDIQELLNGQGWGLAKIAELNGYPGPRHVLDMGDELNLSDDQILLIEDVFVNMKEQAIEKGKSFIAAENDLEMSFQESEIEEDELIRLTQSSANARAELRSVHLIAHLKMMDILETDQITKYNNLRGYSFLDPCSNVPEGHNPELWKKHNRCSDN